ncbi:hypothetical protein HELRODRAFT_164934 [Helobdella robusta]|uniref:Endonuclease/exonuclease/phosphatase domain-containing protein n=1 Tax=Helobdella robusta TaxID=6412 RepID=T1EVZ5_HELRO|nr:hypothetical protein HELRODRAFT_164934 [Helobdella robusta]ESN92811.1 hypothetical protein HELRODRAFT_164934 [Helobdella robusta]
MNNQLVKFSNWFTGNKLVLNSKKSYLAFGPKIKTNKDIFSGLTIHIGDSVIFRNSSAKFLGIIIQQKGLLIPMTCRTDLNARYWAVRGIRLWNSLELVAPNVDGVYGLISDGLDVLVLTETWHGLAGNNSVNIAKPPGYCYVDFVRKSSIFVKSLVVERGGTLDLVVSSADFLIISTTVFPHGVFSDHNLITIKAVIVKLRRTTAKFLDHGKRMMKIDLLKQF